VNDRQYTVNEDGTIEHEVMIRNKRGLHARAAARFVKLAGQYDANITVTHKDTSVSGRSIMGLMMLAASPGSQVRLTATGPQAEAAIEAITALIAAKFDEED
jgi:phosphocarrier protein HPr